jgi:hypothetical protein
LYGFYEIRNTTRHACCSSQSLLASPLVRPKLTLHFFFSSLLILHYFRLDMRQLNGRVNALKRENQKLQSQMEDKQFYFRAVEADRGVDYDTLKQEVGRASKAKTASFALQIPLSYLRNIPRTHHFISQTPHNHIISPRKHFLGDSAAKRPERHV